MKKQNWILKSISIVTIICFGVSTIAWSAPIQNSPLPNSKNQQTSVISEINKLISKDEGKISDAYFPDYCFQSNADCPVVIHIQDAHANPEAQSNIKKMLGRFNDYFENSGRKLPIALESAVNPLQPEILQLLPQYPEINQAVIDDLAGKGELTGTELFVLDQYKKSKNAGSEQIEHQSQARGVEDGALFRDNLYDYRMLLNERPQIDLLTAPLMDLFLRTKSLYFKGDLKKFDGEKSARSNDRRQILPYLQELVAWSKKVLRIDLNDKIEQLRFPNVTRLIYMGNSEKGIDYKKAQTEWQNIRSTVTGKLTPAQKKELLPLIDQLTEAMKQPAAYDGGVPPRWILEQLNPVFKTFKIDLSQYPQFSAAAAFLVLQSEIDAKELFTEIEGLESVILNHLARTLEEKELIRLGRELELLKKLVHGEMTRDEFMKYRAKESLLRPENILKRISQLRQATNAASDKKSASIDTEKLNQYIERAVRFYETAQRREVALVSHTLKFLDEEQPKRLDSQNHFSYRPVALVSGGFHTDGIKSILRKKQIPYLVISPHMSKLPDENLYTRVMLGKNADYSLLPSLSVGTNTVFRAQFLDPDYQQLMKPISPAESQIDTRAVVIWGAYSDQARKLPSTQAEPALAALARLPLFTALLKNRRTELRLNQVGRRDVPLRLATANEEHQAEVTVIPGDTELKQLVGDYFGMVNGINQFMLFKRNPSGTDYGSIGEKINLRLGSPHLVYGEHGVLIGRVQLKKSNDRTVTAAFSPEPQRAELRRVSSEEVLASLNRLDRTEIKFIKNLRPIKGVNVPIGLKGIAQVVANVSATTISGNVRGAVAEALKEKFHFKRSLVSPNQVAEMVARALAADNLLGEFHISGRQTSNLKPPLPSSPISAKTTRASRRSAAKSELRVSGDDAEQANAIQNLFDRITGVMATPVKAPWSTAEKVLALFRTELGGLADDALRSIFDSIRRNKTDVPIAIRGTVQQLRSLLEAGEGESRLDLSPELGLATAAKIVEEKITKYFGSLNTNRGYVPEIDQIVFELRSYISTKPDSQELQDFVAGVLELIFRLHIQYEARGEDDGKDLVGHAIYVLAHGLNSSIVGIFSQDRQIVLNAWNKKNLREKIKWSDAKNSLVQETINMARDSRAELRGILSRSTAKKASGSSFSVPISENEQWEWKFTRGTSGHYKKGSDEISFLTGFADAKSWPEQKNLVWEVNHSPDGYELVIWRTQNGADVLKTKLPNPVDGEISFDWDVSQSSLQLPGKFRFFVRGIDVSATHPLENARLIVKNRKLQKKRTSPLQKLAPVLSSLPGSSSVAEQGEARRPVRIRPAAAEPKTEPQGPKSELRSDAEAMVEIKTGKVEWDEGLLKSGAISPKDFTAKLLETLELIKQSQGKKGILALPKPIEYGESVYVAAILLGDGRLVSVERRNSQKPNTVVTFHVRDVNNTSEDGMPLDIAGVTPVVVDIDVSPRYDKSSRAWIMNSVTKGIVERMAVLLEQNIRPNEVLRVGSMMIEAGVTKREEAGTKKPGITITFNGQASPVNGAAVKPEDVAYYLNRIGEIIENRLPRKLGLAAKVVGEDDKPKLEITINGKLWRKAGSDEKADPTIDPFGADSILNALLDAITLAALSPKGRQKKAVPALRVVGEEPLQEEQPTGTDGRNELRAISLADVGIAAMVEKAKDEFAAIQGIGKEKRNQGYQQAIKRMGGEAIFNGILNDKLVAGNEKAQHELIRLLAFGKGETLQRFTVLSDDGRKNYLSDLITFIGPNLVTTESIYQKYIVRSEKPFELNVTPTSVTAPPTTSINRQGDLSPEERSKLEQIADTKAFQLGNVAMFQVAGGSGARLGYMHPKGMFQMGPVRKMALFERFARNIAAIERRYSKSVPWVIMTSDADNNHEETVEFFQNNISNGKFFGLIDIESVVFAKQRVLPTFQDNGEFLVRPPSPKKDDSEDAVLEGSFEVGGFGHGDANDYILQDRDVLQTTRFIKDTARAEGFRREDGPMNIYRWLRSQKKIEYMEFIQIDNALAIPSRVAFGAHIQDREKRGALPPGIEHVSPIVVEKYPSESTGMVTTVGGHDVVLEYNQVPAELTYMTYAYTVKESDQELFLLLTRQGGQVIAIDFAGWQKKLDGFIEGLKDAKGSKAWRDAVVKFHKDQLLELQKLSLTQEITYQGKSIPREKFVLWLRNSNLNAHIWTLPSIKHSAGETLPVVVDRGKTRPAINADGTAGTAVRNKAEIMVFNAAKSGPVLETARAEVWGGFAPLKNDPKKTNVDTPETAAVVLSQAFGNYLKEAGWAVDDAAVVELDPSLTGYDDFATFKEKVGKGSLGKSAKMLLTGENVQIGQLQLSDNAEFLVSQSVPGRDDEIQLTIGNQVVIEPGVRVHIRFQGFGELVVEDGAVIKQNTMLDIKPFEVVTIKRDGSLISSRSELRELNQQGSANVLLEPRGSSTRLELREDVSIELDGRITPLVGGFFGKADFNKKFTLLKFDSRTGGYSSVGDPIQLTTLGVSHPVFDEDRVLIGHVAFRKLSGQSKEVAVFSPIPQRTTPGSTDRSNPVLPLSRLDSRTELRSEAPEPEEILRTKLPPRVGIVGLNHTGVLMTERFVRLGLEVIGYDSDPSLARQAKVDYLKAIDDDYISGSASFYEEPKAGTEEEVASSARSNDGLRNVLRRSDIIFLNIDPSKITSPAEYERYVTELVLNAAKELQDLRTQDRDNSFKTFVFRSIVPFHGRADVRQAIENIIAKYQESENFEVIYQPIFLRRDATLKELMAEQIIIGTKDGKETKGSQLMRRLFKAENKDVSIVLAKTRSAELAHSYIGLFLTMKLALANMFQVLVRETGGNLNAICLVAGTDVRTLTGYLKTGLGFGGWLKTIAKVAYNWLGRELENQDYTRYSYAQQALGKLHQLLRQVLDINEDCVQRMKVMIREKFQFVGGLGGKKVVLLGIGSSPQSGRMDGSVAAELIKWFVSQNVSEVSIYDPYAEEEFEKWLAKARTEGSFLGYEGINFKFVNNKIELQEALKGSDFAVVGMHHQEVMELDPKMLAESLGNKIFFDGWGIYGVQPDKKAVHSLSEVKNAKLNYLDLSMPVHGNGSRFFDSRVLLSTQEIDVRLREINARLGITAESEQPKKIAVVGAGGYVGLIQAVELAELGYDVVGIENNLEKLAKLQQGIPTIYEPGLEELLKKHVKSGKIKFTNDVAFAVQNSQAFYITVGTPSGDDGGIDSTDVEKAAHDIGVEISKMKLEGKIPARERKIIIVKSTVTPDVFDHISLDLSSSLGLEVGEHYALVSNPEFLREGYAIRDVRYPDRIAFGLDTKMNSQSALETEKFLLQLMRPRIEMVEAARERGEKGIPSTKVIITDMKSAMLGKYLANCFLALCISFANVCARVAKLMGADWQEVAKIMRGDSRIMRFAFLAAGVGYGGSCFPKDVKALLQFMKRNGFPATLLELVEEINQWVKEEAFVDQVTEAIYGKVWHRELVAKPLEGKQVTIWGLAFKPDTDDIREAPAFDVILGLLRRGAKVKAHDPLGKTRENFIRAIETEGESLGLKSGRQKERIAELKAYLASGQLEIVDDRDEAANGSDALVLLTEWKDPKFQNYAPTSNDNLNGVDFSDILERMIGNIIVAGRDLWNGQDIAEYGFRFFAVSQRDIILEKSEADPELRQELRTAGNDHPNEIITVSSDIVMHTAGVHTSGDIFEITYNIVMERVKRYAEKLAGKGVQVLLSSAKGEIKNIPLSEISPALFDTRDKDRIEAGQSLIPAEDFAADVKVLTIRLTLKGPKLTLQMHQNAIFEDLEALMTNASETDVWLGLSEKFEELLWSDSIMDQLEALSIAGDRSDLNNENMIDRIKKLSETKGTDSASKAVRQQANYALEILKVRRAALELARREASKQRAVETGAASRPELRLATSRQGMSSMIRNKSRYTLITSVFEILVLGMMAAAWFFYREVFRDPIIAWLSAGIFIAVAMHLWWSRNLVRPAIHNFFRPQTDRTPSGVAGPAERLLDDFANAPRIPKKVMPMGDRASVVVGLGGDERVVFDLQKNTGADSAGIEIQYTSPVGFNISRRTSSGDEKIGPDSPKPFLLKERQIMIFSEPHRGQTIELRFIRMERGEGDYIEVTAMPATQIIFKNAFEKARDAAASKASQSGERLELRSENSSLPQTVNATPWQSAFDNNLPTRRGIVFGISTASLRQGVRNGMIVPSMQIQEELSTVADVIKRSGNFVPRRSYLEKVRPALVQNFGSTRKAERYLVGMTNADVAEAVKAQVIQVIDANDFNADAFKPALEKLARENVKLVLLVSGADQNAADQIRNILRREISNIIRSEDISRKFSENQLVVRAVADQLPRDLARFIMTGFINVDPKNGLRNNTAVLTSDTAVLNNIRAELRFLDDATDGRADALLKVIEAALNPGLVPSHHGIIRLSELRQLLQQIGVQRQELRLQTVSA